jgi:hypothetical protein
MVGFGFSGNCMLGALLLCFFVFFWHLYFCYSKVRGYVNIVHAVNFCDTWNADRTALST